nr:hypothetical protein [uncultured Acetatifactor sp.]
MFLILPFYYAIGKSTTLKTFGKEGLQKTVSMFTMFLSPSTGLVNRLLAFFGRNR